MRKITLAAAYTAIALAVGPAMAQSVPGITKDTIKIGTISPMTGPAAVFGRGVFGVEALLKDANDKGGIHGRKIEIVREDDGCDPTRGIAATKKLISQDRVFAIIGVACSGVAMAVKDDIAKTDVPWMVMGAATDGVSRPTVSNVFQGLATTSTVGRTMIDFAMSKPGTDKIAFVSHSDDWGKSNREPAIRHLKEKFGKDAIADLTMERGSTDATPQILRIRQSGAQAVILMMYPAELAIFVRDAHKYGLKVPMFGPQSISLEDTRDRVGLAAVENLYVFYPFIDAFDSPAMKTWAQLITKHYPGERVESFTYLSMGATLAVIEALKRAGPDLTREKLIAALDSLKNFETGVMSAPITFSPQDHAGVKGGAMATFKNGKVIVTRSNQ